MSVTLIAAPPSSVQATRPALGTYAELHRQVEALGLFRPQSGYYLVKAASLVAMFALGVFGALWFSHPAIVLAVAAFLGVANVQAGLLGHDVGHHQLLRSRRWHHLVALVLANLLLGLSYSWWIAKHNRHHSFPNEAGKDPDGEVPVLVLCADQIPTRHRLLRPLIAVQAFLFVFWLPLHALSMRGSGVGHLWIARPTYRGVEVIALVVHAAAYGLLLWLLGSWELAIAFAAVQQGVMGVYSGLVFAPNHKGMPVLPAESEMEFVRKQVVTARNVRPGALTDWYYGGLNYQIEHHLFPSMPRNRLRRIQATVRRYCEEHGIPYRETSFMGSYADLFRHLHTVSAPLRRLGRPFAKGPQAGLGAG